MNNYKTTSLFRGISAKSDNPYELNISKSNLEEGISKEDFAVNADVAVGGSLGRAIDTRMGGYKTKIFNSSFPSIILDKAGTDCKTIGYELLEITESNKDSLRFRYFMEGEQLCVIEEFFESFRDDEEKSSFISNLNKSIPFKNIKIYNINQLIGKKIKLRTPNYCNSKHLCNVCAGNMFYKLNIVNLGLLTNLISGKLMNYSMKSFHDPSVKMVSFKLSEYITEE